MFNPDFYPTPEAVFYKMIEGYDITGKTILEASAGSGTLVELLKLNGAKEVISCENEPDLRTILESKCKVIASDFLTVTSEQISHVDYILMNPPFSKGAQHILHAWNIAPAGCQIIALANLNTVKNRYSSNREELGALIQANGSFDDIGQAFNEAQRTTGVEVALIRLKKPSENYDQEFEGFFMDEDPQEQQANGLMPYNLIRDIVQRYTEAVKIYDTQLETALKLNRVMGDVFNSHDRDKINPIISIEVTENNVKVNRAEFKKRMQKSGWLYIFDKLNMKKHTTKGLREDINKFVEQQTQIPFTMKNIYRMLEVVISTTSQRMDKAILEVFDKLTQHYDENRYKVEGWKTNSHYLINRKFIMPHVVEANFSGGIRTNYNGWAEPIEDMQKAICYLTGMNYDKCTEFSRFLDHVKWGQEHCWGFFNIRCFKKGTVHFTFQSEDLWAKFNQKVAQLKGYPLYEYKATKNTAKADQETAKHYRPNVNEEREPKMPTMNTEIIKAANQNVIQSLLF